MVFLGWFLINPKTGLAKDYSIDEVKIINTVNRDGSMAVEERRVYNFDGSYSFAYQYINEKGERDEPYVLENFEICDENKCYRQKEDENNVAGTFFVRNEADRYYLKWFYKANSEKKTFSLKYRVKNVVDLGQDLAQIYWKPIGNDWGISQKNVEIEFKLPPGIGDKEINAWGHGPIEGKVSIPDNQLVKFEWRSNKKKGWKQEY